MLEKLSPVTAPLPEILHKKYFYKKVIRNVCFALILLFISLGIGMYGYHHFEKMSLIDSFANASMILAGMGPLDPIHTWQGKLFAGIYALYSGVAFLIVIAFVLAPVIHRFFHKIHLDASKK